MFSFLSSVHTWDFCLTEIILQEAPLLLFPHDWCLIIKKTQKTTSNAQNTTASELGIWDCFLFFFSFYRVYFYVLFVFSLMQQKLQQQQLVWSCVCTGLCAVSVSLLLSRERESRGGRLSLRNPSLLLKKRMLSNCQNFRFKSWWRLSVSFSVAFDTALSVHEREPWSGRCRHVCRCFWHWCIFISRFVFWEAVQLCGGF